MAGRGRPATGRSAAASEAILAEQSDLDGVDDLAGQLELFDTADLVPAQMAEAAWAASPTGLSMLAAVTCFGQGRGWRLVTIQAVQHGVTLSALTDHDLALEATISELRRRRVPISPLRDFLTGHGLISTDPEGIDSTRWVQQRLPGLPATMTAELHVWVDTLRGTRRASARAVSTIDGYRRWVEPVLRDWAQSYLPLREVRSLSSPLCK